MPQAAAPDSAIEAAAWRAEHAALLARHSPSVDFSRPRTTEDAPHNRIKVAVSDGEGHRSAPHIICRHGITGLDCGREAVVELAESAAVLDLEIAHFGEAPEVKVFGAGDRVIAELTMDPRPRQIERLRVVDKSIRKAIVRAKGGSVLLVSASTPPAELLLKV